jgi:hypothetical protein
MKKMQTRFSVKNGVVSDTQTGLMWTRDAAVDEFPLTWFEALAFITQLNERRYCGFTDWRLPNRRELFSLVSHRMINPALPPNHSFVNVFAGYYWTSTSCSRLPDQAWYVHLGGARVFKGMKHGSYMVWPVRTADTSACLPYRTGQSLCYAADHTPTPCPGSGQDGELRTGRPWPPKRFTLLGDATIRDHLTGLCWQESAGHTSSPVDWPSAIALAATANRRQWGGHHNWRLPGIRELESLCDSGTHTPALPQGHPFKHVQSEYWSSTTSRYDDRYAWVLYLRDGAVGVGYKPGREFHVWLVSGTVNG